MMDLVLTGTNPRVAFFTRNHYKFMFLKTYLTMKGKRSFEESVVAGGADDGLFHDKLFINVR